MVDDKIHARSTGPYLLPSSLCGKAQFGGQRFGDGGLGTVCIRCANVLQEILTVKSLTILTAVL